MLPLLAGVAAAMFLDAWILYRLFGSRIFPAEGAWPPGLAAAAGFTLETTPESSTTLFHQW